MKQTRKVYYRYLDDQSTWRGWRWIVATKGGKKWEYVDVDDAKAKSAELEAAGYVRG